MHCRGNAAICRAMRVACASASPLGAMALTSPMPLASCAPTGRPVRIMSIACPMPTTRGSLTVPPSISGTPQRRQNTPNTASSSATRRSASSASSSPPATAWPATAAISGFDSAMRLGPIGPGPSPDGSTLLRNAGSPTAFRSAPAQKLPPAPVRIATPSAASASKRSNASLSSNAVGPSMALRRSGRLMVIVQTAPSVA